jgi:ABC-type multidrug transport system ATPase subunit
MTAYVLYVHLPILYDNRIKGLSSAAVAAVTRASMEELGLTQFEHVRSGQLSGGNKRKLSLAIALVGEPEVMFLDEPSVSTTTY